MTTILTPTGSRQPRIVQAPGLSPEAAGLVRGTFRAYLQRPLAQAAATWSAVASAPRGAVQGPAEAQAESLQLAVPAALTTLPVALQPAAPLALQRAVPSVAVAVPAAGALVVATPVSEPSRQSLHALLFALVAEGGPSAYRFAMTVLQQENQAVMAMLNAWGKSLRANAKLEKKAHARAERQVRARLSALRRGIELSRAQQSHLRQAGLRAERYSVAHTDGWGQMLRHHQISARFDERPGLAPTPPTPLAGAGGLQLRRPPPGGDLLDL